MTRLRLSLCLLVAACGNPAPTAPPLPAQDVELIVDKLGVTHVYAQSDADAYFGAGYAMARDRLFEMELFRRKALGTSAELFGAPSVTGDRSARVLGFARLGAADAARMQSERPDDYALVQAWVAGVNRRIDEIGSGAAPRPYGFGKDELDFLPAPWTAEDAFAVGKTLAFGLSNSLDSEVLATVLRTVVPQTAAHLPVSLPAYDTYIVGQANGGAGAGGPAPPNPPPPPGGWLPDGYREFFPQLASNNWAVDGAHTSNGKPILCGDPHQPLTSPSRFWPFAMNSTAGGGTLDVQGFAFVGTPSVELGFNAHLGWTATTDFADAMDLWDVETDGPLDTVKIGGNPVATVKREETIKVRGGDDVTFEVAEVPGYGVILPEEILPVPKYLLVKGQLLLDWTGLRPTREASVYMALDRAGDLDAFERAVDLMDVGAVNLVAADATGIDYHVHAAVPDRGDPSSHPMPWHVLDGNDPSGLWTRGDLPPEKLPHLRAPTRGFIVTANNDPFGFTSDGNVENDPYYYGAFFSNGLRAHRIEEALTAALANGGKVSPEDMQALQADVHSDLADTLLPHLADAAAAIGTDAALQQYVGRADLTDLAARLAAWDRNFADDSEAAVIFLGVEWFAAKRAFAAKLTDTLFDAVVGRSPPFALGMLRNVVEHRFADADLYLPDGLNALLVGALDDTAKWLAARFGSLAPGSFTLGKLQQAAFPNDYGHALTPAPVPVGGSDDTVRVTEGAFFAKGQPLQMVTASEMSLYRMTLTFDGAGAPVVAIDFARGASGEPDSPRFDDQQPLWQKGGHVPWAFKRADVEAEMTGKATLPAAK